jgi:hypothetical protein
MRGVKGREVEKRGIRGRRFRKWEGVFVRVEDGLQRDLDVENRVGDGAAGDSGAVHIPRKDSPGPERRLHEPARLDAGVEEKCDPFDQGLGVLGGSRDFDVEQGRIRDACLVVDEIDTGLRVDGEVGDDFTPIELEHELRKHCVLIAVAGQRNRKICLRIPVRFVGRRLSALSFVVGDGIWRLHDGEPAGRSRGTCAKFL